MLRNRLPLFISGHFYDVISSVPASDLLMFSVTTEVLHAFGLLTILLCSSIILRHHISTCFSRIFCLDSNYSFQIIPSKFYFSGFVYFVIYCHEVLRRLANVCCCLSLPGFQSNPHKIVKSWKHSSCFPVEISSIASKARIRKVCLMG